MKKRAFRLSHSFILESFIYSYAYILQKWPRSNFWRYNNEQTGRIGYHLPRPYRNEPGIVINSETCYDIISADIGGNTKKVPLLV